MRGSLMSGCNCSSRSSVTMAGTTKIPPTMRITNNNKVIKQPRSFQPRRGGFCAGQAGGPLGALLDALGGKLIFGCDAGSAPGDFLMMGAGGGGKAGTRPIGGVGVCLSGFGGSV